jgi:cytochrome c peroxidase
VLFSEVPMNTPTLVGIAATAPYLHDGTAETLRSLLLLTRSGQMGDTSSLSKSELLDLEDYLRSL